MALGSFPKNKSLVVFHCEEGDRSSGQGLLNAWNKRILFLFSLTDDGKRVADTFYNVSGDKPTKTFVILILYNPFSIVFWYSIKHLGCFIRKQHEANFVLLFQVGEQTVYTGSNFPGVHLDKTVWTEIPSTWQGRQEDQNFKVKVIFSYVDEPYLSQNQNNQKKNPTTTK